MAVTWKQRVAYRSATPADAEALAVVYLESAEHHYRLDPSAYARPDPDAVAARYAQRLADHSEVMVFVAEVAPDIIGYVDIELKHPDGTARMLRDAITAEVDIAVLEEYRSRGIGSELMKRAEGWAADKNVEMMSVNVHSANVDAIRFYQERQEWRTSGLFLMKRPNRQD